MAAAGVSGTLGALPPPSVPPPLPRDSLTDSTAMPIPPEMLAELQAELERQRIRLERSMAVTEQAVKPVQLDQQAVGRLSRMDSLQSQHMSRNLQEREQARYSAITAALKRIADGTYGVCTDCGAAIAPGRLFVLPEVAHCPACAG